MEYIKFLEKQEKIEPANIQEYFQEAQNDRASEWEEQSQEAWRIREGNLPLSESLDNIKNYKGKYYVDNWIKKAMTWRISHQIGGDVYIDVESSDGTISPDMILMENEINFSFLQFDYITERMKVVADREWVGYGVSEQIYNTRRIDNYWKTGKPQIRHIDSRNVWFKATDSMCRDISRIFVCNAVPTDELKEKVAEIDPELAKEITESTGCIYQGNSKQYKNLTNVVTYQYKKTKIVRKREAQYGEDVWYAFDDEVKDIENNKIEIPEGVYISPDHIEVEEDLWYQVIWLPDNNIMLPQGNKKDNTKIKYIGKIPSYQFYPNKERSDSCYPFGLPYDLKDVQEMSISLMTSLVFQVAKMNKPTPEVFPEALKNYDQFIMNHWKLDAVAEKDPEFFVKYPHISPDKVVTYKNVPINAQVYMVLQEMITNITKTSTGSVDSSRGEQQYSGQSGVLAAQLQMASQVFLFGDTVYYKQYLKDTANWLKESILKYRNYEHRIIGGDEQGRRIPVEVPAGTYEEDKYVCVPYVENSPEMVKQARNERLTQLFTSGMLDPLTYFKETDLAKNPEQMTENVLRHQGLLNIKQAMDNNPELEEQFNQLIEQSIQNKKATQ